MPNYIRFAARKAAQRALARHNSSSIFNNHSQTYCRLPTRFLQTLSHYGTFSQEWRDNNQFSPESDSITLVSYNVLSQIQLDKHGFVYKEVDDDVCKSWNHRKLLLEQQFEKFIQKDSVDFFCLQEIDDCQVVDFYQPLFRKFGYEILYQRKTTGSARDPNPPDGLALVYRSEKYSLELQDKVKYLYEYQTTHIPSLKLSYPNIGLIAKFRCRSTQRPLILATTHLTFNPHRGEVKLAQLVLLISRLQALVALDNAPVVITGDMNSAPRGELISKFLATGNFKYLEKRTSEISGQFAYHSNLKTIPKPPLPKELGIDYRDSTKWCDAKESDLTEFRRQQEKKENELKELAKKGGIQFIPSTLELSKDSMDDEFVNPFDVGVVGYIGHRFNLYSPYLKKKFLESNWFSTFFEKEKLQVDHIFVSRSMRVNQYLTLPEAASETRPSLLCRDFPSDHYPIGINFSLPNERFQEKIMK